jgi:hypothetical protein
MIIRRMGVDYTISTEAKGVSETVTLIYIYTLNCYREREYSSDEYMIMEFL